MSLIELILILLLHSARLCEGCQWSNEAEHGITNGTVTHRGDTSNKQTVRLSEGQYVVWGFVTDSSCLLQVFNIEYTNDGLSDTITVYVDGRIAGSFNTRSQSGDGHLWNEPVSTGKVGNETMLFSGDHTIKLVATEVDEHEVEIDKVTLALLCINDISDSEGQCPKSQEPGNVSNNDSWDKGHIIALVFGIVGALIGLITFISGIYYHCKRNKDRYSPQT